MDDLFEHKIELLWKEMDWLQSGIRAYDGTLFTIKGWAITVFSGFLLFAADKQKPIFLLLCITTVLLFWVVDATYRSIQRIYIVRYNTIEGFIQNGGFDQAIKAHDFGTFQIPDLGASFNVRGIKKYVEILKVAFMYHNALLYLPMLVIAVTLMAVR